MTIKELKEILRDWPEKRTDGSPTEVWIETGVMLSSLVIDHCRLNTREGVADLLLESDAFENRITIIIK